ncbi:MAG TPA: hypothetical protein VLJ58_14610 [Ramlibacter sp.]|nr:hypothetical protein [Ramlibacter sp.]
MTRALATLFPADPPRFMARVPHGYHDRAAIEADVMAGGFDKPVRIETRTERSRAASARIAALAYCQGTPLRNEIEARAPGRLEEATGAAEQEVARCFGAGPVEGRIQAHVVEVER